MAKGKTKAQTMSPAPAQLRARAGESYFARGQAYFRSGAVRSLNISAHGADAAVQGTRRYRVRLSMENGELGFTCSCPLGRDDAFCKHVVAVGLAWGAEIGSGQVDAGKPPPQPRPEDALRAHLLNLNKEELVAALLERAGEDELLMRRLTLLTAKQAPADAAASTWKRAFDDALATDDYVGYHGAYDYMSGVDEVLDNLETLLRDGRADKVVALAEYAMEEIEHALDHVDDSDGYMGGLLARAQDLHLKACQAARPDPVELAERLFELESDSSFDVCHGAYATYADILGETGLAAYRRLAEAQWAKVKPLRPGEDDGERYGRRFRITSIMETIAKQDGDVEARAAIMARDLSRPYDFLQIAELYRDAGAAGKALEWAERGWRAFARGRQDDRLRAFLADAYQKCGRRDEAVALMWDGFEAALDIRAYQALEVHARRARAWKTWREKAHGLVRARVRSDKTPAGRWGGGHSLLVQIFLHEGDDAAAWREAQSGGRSLGLWLELAKRREATHPDDAVRIYRDHIDALLRGTGARTYEEAVWYLEKIQALMRRAKKPEAFANIARDIRNAHARKRNLIKLLDAKKW